MVRRTSLTDRSTATARQATGMVVGFRLEPVSSGTRLAAATTTLLVAACSTKPTPVQPPAAAWDSGCRGPPRVLRWRSSLHVGDRVARGSQSLLRWPLAAGYRTAVASCSEPVLCYKLPESAPAGTRQFESPVAGNSANATPVARSATLRPAPVRRMFT